jgi:CheY-like chemotaxis protein
MVETRIFRVDDDEISQSGFKRRVRQHGGEVVLSATSVTQALAYIPDRLISSKIDLALIDNQLGDGTGETIADQIRNYSELFAQSGLSIAIFSFSSDESIKWGDRNFRKQDREAPVMNAIRSMSQK